MSHEKELTPVQSQDEFEITEVSTVSIAEQCHEANRTFCQQIGDMSQPSWKDAPQWQVDSAIMGVGIHINGIKAGNHVTPEQSHISWMNQKLNDGWVYGEVKDAELKTHPCITDYSNLPQKQQIKDHIFRGIVHTMYPFIGRKL